MSPRETKNFGECSERTRTHGIRIALKTRRSTFLLRRLGSNTSTGYHARLETNGHSSAGVETSTWREDWKPARLGRRLIVAFDVEYLNLSLVPKLEGLTAMATKLASHLVEILTVVNLSSPNYT